MLKKSAIKRIIISSLSLILVSIICIFPSSYKKNTIKEEVLYFIPFKSAIYIPNKDNFVSRMMVMTKDKETINLAKELLAYLTINNPKSSYLPNGFSPIIPKNTKVLDMSLDTNMLKINFSKDFFNISAKDIDRLIESITYTLTEITGIDKIMIFVEGNHLDKFPNDNKKLPLVLDRSFGINKTYYVEEFKNTSMITTYYISKDNNNDYYYVPISKIENNNNEKIEIIIQELKSTPIYQTNLMSFLNSNAKLLDYEILERQISLSFNNYLLDDIKNKNILEEVKYSIGLSIKDTYNIDKVIFKVDDYLEELIIK